MSIFFEIFNGKNIKKFFRPGVNVRAGFVCALFVFSAGAALATDYTWNGGTSGAWSEVTNWLAGGAVPTDVPGSGDTAIFTGTDTVTITDSSVTSGTITSGAGITFSGSLTASGDITISSGDLTVAGDLTVTGTTTVTDGNLTVSGSYTGIKPSDTVTADISVSGDFVVENTTETLIRGIVNANSISIKKGRTSLLGGATSITTNETQIYAGEVLVNSDITITASTVTFGDKLVSWTASDEDAKSVNIVGNAVFNGRVGAETSGSLDTKLASFTVTGISTVGANVYTTGVQSYGGLVTLGSDSVTFSTEGDITLSGGLTGTSSGSGTVTLGDSASSYSNTITVGGAVTGVNAITFNGNADVNAAITASGAVTFAGDADLTVAVESTGAGVTFSGAATVGAVVTAKTDVTFSSTAEVNVAVSADNDIFFLGEATVAANVTAGNALDFDKTATIGADLSAKNAATFEDVTLSSDVGITASTATFNGKLVSAGSSDSNAKSATITGNAVFQKTIGAETSSADNVKLSSLTVSGTSTVGSNVYTTGDQSYGGAVTLGSAVELSSTGGNINFGTSTSSAATVGATSGSTVDLTVTVSDSSKNVYFYGGFSGSTKLNLYGNAEIYGDNTFSSFTETASSFAATFNFYGSNNFSSLNLTAGGAPINVNFADGSTQTISSISSKGADATNCVTLNSISGTWNVVFTANPSASDFTYTVVGNSHSVDSSGAKNELGLIPTEATVRDLQPSTPTTVSWFSHSFYWLGGTDTKWQTVGNWAYDAAGTYTTAIYPSYTDGLSEITVVKGTSASSSPYILTLEEDVTAKSIQIEAGVTADFAGCDVTADITNNGTLKLAGTESITGTKTNGTDSTVQYYGSAMTSLSWGTEYENLEFVSGAAGSAGEAMNVEKTLVIQNGTDNALSLYGAGAFTGAVTLTDAGNITFGGTNNFNDELKIDSAGDVTFGGANTFDGAVNVVSANDVSFSEANTFNGAVNVVSAGDVTFSAVNTFAEKITITQVEDVSFTGENSFGKTVQIDSAGNVILNADSNGIMLEDGAVCTTLDAKCAVTLSGSITTSGSLTADVGTVGQYYESTVHFADGAVLTDSAAKAVYIKGAATGDGSITINAGATFAGTLDASGALTVGGILKVNDAVGSARPLTDINVTGDATFSGTLDASGALTVGGILKADGAVGSTKAPTDINVTGDATFGSTLDASGALTVGGILKADGAVGSTTAPTDINVTGDATFDSTLDANGALTFNANAVFTDAVGANTAPAEISVTVETHFNASGTQTVQTLGAQTYSQKITVESALTLTADDGDDSTDEKITLNGIAEGTSTLSSINIKSAIAELYAADYSTYGSQTFECSKGVRILSSLSAADGSWQCKNSDGKITLNGTELFLDFDSSAITLKSSLEAENVFFYSGALTLSGVTVKTTDFAAFGSSYSAVDSRFSSSNTRFAYSGADSVEYRRTSDFSASLACSGGAEIDVSGNFYANGLNLASFTLNIPDNSSSNPVFNPTDAVTQNQWGLPYAVAFNSDIASVTVAGGWLTAGAEDSVAGISAQNCTDSGSNTNVQFNVPHIQKAYSVYDDVIYVEFDRALENSNGEISTNLALFSNGSLSEGGAWYSSQNFYFEGAFSDADCTTAISSDTDLLSFYLKGTDTWNTDATGTLAYNSAARAAQDSTDRSGQHKAVTTDLSFLEGLFTAADGHTMCSTYSGTTAYTATEDHTAPVLIASYTGQEQHATGTSTTQSTYDSHNFVELRYSEAVDIGLLLNDGEDLNIRATDSLGNITGSGTQSTDGTGLTLAGLAEISDGKLLAFSKTDSASPHSLYRSFGILAGETQSAQTHRIRISIAGYVDGTVDFTDSKNPSYSGTYHNWTGCITSATTPEGTVKALENSAITDLALSSDGTKLQNILDVQGSANHALKTLTLNEYSDGTQKDSEKTGSLYGEWDTLPPVIAPFITKQSEWTEWAAGTASSIKKFEIIGTTDTTSDSTLKYVEVHLLDNDRTQVTKWSDKWWRTKQGWNEDGSLPETRGGARPYTADSLTTGGIRLSSLKNENSAFTYKLSADSASAGEQNFDTSTDISQITYGNVFRSRTDPSTQTDGLYLRFGLTDFTLPIRTVFEFFYNPEDSYITDLAGNLLSSSYASKTSFTSIDLTSPSILLTLAPVGENKIYAVFSKELAYVVPGTEGKKITTFEELDSSSLSTAMSEIADSFAIVAEGSAAGTKTSQIGIKGCEYVSSSSEYTALLFTLEENISLSNVEILWLRNISHGSDTVDDNSGITVSDTKILDSVGNYMVVDTGHAISDFAVNAAEPLFAYANAKDGDDWSEQGLYGQGIAASSEDYAVHDFTASQGNYGKLTQGRDITVQVKVNGGTDSAGSTIAPADRTFVMIPSKTTALTDSMVSDKINGLINTDWRLWLPTALKSVATDANTGTLASPADPVSADEDAGFLWNYTFPDSDYGFKNGDEIQFLFKIVDSSGSDITIDHDADDFGGATQPTARVPLYAVKMPSAKISAGDFSFVDLWSFGIKSLKQQRGGVTILNNVINVLVREQTVVEVTTKEEGTLNVFVMTLDGNIVKRLNHGRVSAGTHYYRWNGTNNSGSPVARGMYFIRVVGPGIDETRKVMCVKEN